MKAKKRSGTKYIPFSDADPEREIVSLCEHKNDIYVATKVGVYKIVDDKLVRLKFVIEEATIKES